MTLPSTIVLRPNEFSQPDFSVIYKDPDGRELSVGRIFHDTAGTIHGATPDVAVEALREHRKQVLEVRMKIGAGKLPADALLFSNLEGLPLRPSAPYRRTGAKSPRASECLKLHSMRFATLMLVN